MHFSHCDSTVLYCTVMIHEWTISSQIECTVMIHEKCMVTHMHMRLHTAGLVKFRTDSDFFKKILKVI